GFALVPQDKGYAVEVPQMEFPAVLDVVNQAAIQRDKNGVLTIHADSIRIPLEENNGTVAIDSKGTFKLKKDGKSGQLKITFKARATGTQSGHLEFDLLADLKPGDPPPPLRSEEVKTWFENRMNNPSPAMQRFLKSFADKIERAIK
ncbi:MAG: hypothetical protein AAF412_01855, partial [Pseudomonadota bacterium]